VGFQGMKRCGLAGIGDGPGKNGRPVMRGQRGFVAASCGGSL